MILDFKRDSGNAIRFRVICKESGEDLSSKLPIWYADDRYGLLQVYRVVPGSSPRLFEIDPDTREPVSDEVRRPIKIVPKR